MKGVSHNGGHLGQFIFHFIIKNGHVIDEVGLSEVMWTKAES